MVEPPSRYARRRAERRRQLRRRRLAGAGAVLAVIVILVLVVSSAVGGSKRGSSRPVRAAETASGDAGSGRGPGAPRLSAVDARGNRVAARLAKLGLPIYCGGNRGNEVAFTFDDGPGPYTTLALEKLRESGERATFFVVGRSMDMFPGWVPRELKLATVGDHTYTHPELTALPAAEVYSEIARTAQKIKAQSGEHVDLFRPPYELHNPTVDRVARQLGLLEVLWNVDSADSLGANYAQIIQSVEAGLRPGSIVLMHENRGQTIRALTTLLPALHHRRLRSVTIPELLANDPPSLAQLRAGRGGCAVAGKVRPGSGG